MTDAAFLAALADTPDDALLRSVYADFLGDAGRHDEADVLRADEAMRRVPVWDDAYWSAKAVRNELRRRCDPAWLSATGCDGSRLHRFFRDGYPEDAFDRWRLLRAFVEQWHQIETPDAGGRADEIEAEERRTKLRFGASLREFVAFALDVCPKRERGPFHPFRYRMEVHPEPSLLAVLDNGGGIHALRLDAVGHDDADICYRWCYPSPLAASGYSYEGHEDDVRLRSLSETVADVCLGSVAKRLTFSFIWERHGGLFRTNGAGTADVFPSVVFEWPGGFVRLFTADDPPGGTAHVSIHPLAAWSCLPASILRALRDARYVRLTDQSPESLTGLLAAFGGDAPRWLQRMLYPATNGDDDIPF